MAQAIAVTPNDKMAIVLACIAAFSPDADGLFWLDSSAVIRCLTDASTGFH